jgi:hypothetical protein
MHTKNTLLVGHGGTEPTRQNRAATTTQWQRPTTMGFWKTAATHYRRKEDALPSNHCDDKHVVGARTSNGDKPSRHERHRLLRGFCSGTSSATTRWRFWILACSLLVCCSLVATSGMLPSSRLLQVLQLPLWPWSTSSSMTTSILPLENGQLPCVNTTVPVPVERIVHVERNVTQIVYNYTKIAKQPTQRACRQIFRAKVRGKL